MVGLNRIWRILNTLNRSLSNLLTFDDQFDRQSWKYSHKTPIMFDDVHLLWIGTLQIFCSAQIMYSEASWKCDKLKVKLNICIEVCIRTYTYLYISQIKQKKCNVSTYLMGVLQIIFSTATVQCTYIKQNCPITNKPAFFLN